MSILLSIDLVLVSIVKLGPQCFLSRLEPVVASFPDPSPTQDTGQVILNFSLNYRPFPVRSIRSKDSRQGPGC